MLSINLLKPAVHKATLANNKKANAHRFLTYSFPFLLVAYTCPDSVICLTEHTLTGPLHLGRNIGELIFSCNGDICWGWTFVLV